MANIVDTNGWHTVSAITYADVNRAIEATTGRPQGLSVEAPDHSASMTGTFGSWRLRLGGSGKLINMELQLTGGSVTGPFGEQGAHTTLPISTCAFPIIVNAEYVPHTHHPSLLDLKLSTDAPVSVEAFDPDQGTPTTSFLANAAVQELLQQWLTANLDDFNVAFASVDLDADYSENEGVKWLTPSYHGYAVSERTEGATLDNSIFGVLSLIDGQTTPPSGLSYEVSAFAIPEGGNAAFLISTEKFLQHMMLAAMPAIFKGISKQPLGHNFKIDNDGTRIRSTRKLSLRPVKLDNGNIVHPSVEAGRFSIAVDGTELVINITDMEFEYSPGIHVSLVYEGRSTLRYDKKRGLLDLRIANQSGSGTVEVSKGMRITEVVTGVATIVLALVSAAGGVVSRTADAAVTSATGGVLGEAEAVGADEAAAEQAMVTALGGLIRGAPGEVAQIGARATAVAKVAAVGGFCTALFPGISEIMTAIAQGKYQSLPKITDLTDAAIGRTVIWPPAVGTFTLDSAQLDAALQFGLVRR